MKALVPRRLRDLLVLTRRRQRQRTAQAIFARFPDIPFWICDSELHARQYCRFGRFCRTNYTVLVPEKRGGVMHPIYPWRKELYDLILIDEKINEPTNRVTVSKQIQDI